MKQGWEIKKLGEVCCKKQQIIRATKKHTPSDNIAYIDISAIDSATNKIIEPTILRFQDAPSRAQQVVEKDDILVSLVRPNLKNIAQVNEDRDDLVASSGFCVLRTKENPKYIKYIVLGERFTTYLISRTSGANYPAVREEDIKEYTIPVPPLPEQEKIVSELDCLSGIIEKKRQQLEELDALAQSIFYEMFGNPVDNERGWETAPLKDTCDKIGDGLHGTPQYDENGLIPFINGTNLENGRIRITDKTQYVNDDEAQKYFIEMNDSTVLLSINGTLGKTALYKGENVILGKSVCYCNLKDQLLTDFVIALMQTNAFKQFLEDYSSKSTIKNVGLKAIRNFSIILPPLPLQQTFAQKIEAIEQQKALIKQSIAEVETLFNARMQEYFE